MIYICTKCETETSFDSPIKAFEAGHRIFGINIGQIKGGQSFAYSTCPSCVGLTVKVNSNNSNTKKYKTKSTQEKKTNNSRVLEEN